jgi:uncharacterized protein (DUF58 family)
MRRVLRVAGRAIVISSLAVVSWLVLGTRPLFYLATLITTYTAIMVPLVLGTNDRIGAVKRLRQAVVQMKSQDTLTISLEGISTRSPLSIRLQPLVPEYIIRESSSWHDRTYILQFHVNRRGVYALGEGILTVTDPLRLFRIGRRLIADEKLTVLPTVLPLEKLRISLTSPLDGQRVSRCVQESCCRCQDRD